MSIDIKVHVSKAIKKVKIGLNWNINFQDLLGKVNSFRISFNPSIKGWIKPKVPPVTEGPIRRWIVATICLSFKLRNAAESTTENNVRNNPINCNSMFKNIDMKINIIKVSVKRV